MAHPYRKLIIFVVLASLIAVAFWGCYPKPIGPVGLVGERPTWAEMGIEQRKLHMRTVILPRAAAVFRSWRPERFAKVDCSLCHGLGAYTENFRMPTSHLPRLSGEILLGSEFKKYPDTTRLKLDRLVPDMADALGQKRFSIITRTGFGCYSCHMGPTGPMFAN